jgi:hypothetical protein
VDGFAQISGRFTGGADLPQLLNAGFTAFEAIRAIARSYEDQAPDLLPALMIAAGCAVEGRNALIEAPSLPPADGRLSALTAIPSADTSAIADQLVALAAVLAQRLADAAIRARIPGDRSACQQAADAAAGIHRLLAAQP